jgi:hypothetical protein
MLKYITLYLIPGVLWTAFLEYFSGLHKDNKDLPSWSMKERLAHMIFWPVSIITFIVMFIRELRK